MVVNITWVLLLLIILALRMPPLDSYRVLIVPFPWQSHSKQLEIIAVELQRTGHDVTFVLPNSETYATHVPLPKLVFDAGGIANDTLLAVAHRRIRNGEGFHDWTLEYVEFQSHMLRKMFQNEQFDHLAKKSHFLLTDAAYTGAVAVADYYNIPFMAISPWGFCPGLFGDLFGIPNDPSYIPTFGADSFLEVVGSSDSMNIIERFLNILALHVVGIFRELTGAISLREIQNQYMTKSVVDKWRDVSLVIVPTDFSFEYPLALPPNVKAVGPLTVKAGNRLPLLYESILQSSHQNAVVVNFGGSLALPKHSFRKILNVLLEIDQPVLWRFGRSTFFAHLNNDTYTTDYTGLATNANRCIDANTRCTSYGLGNNHLALDMQLKIRDHGQYLSINDKLLLFDYLPQNDLLSHSKVNIFISHCGTNGVYEAMYHRVPSVCMPLFGDHWQNARRVLSRQVGAVFPFHTMEESSMIDAIKTLPSNVAVQNALHVISRRLRARKRDSVKEAADLIETFMEYGDASFLRPKGANSSLLTRYFYDVIAMLILVPLALRAVLLYAKSLVLGKRVASLK